MLRFQMVNNIVDIVNIADDGCRSDLPSLVSAAAAAAC